MKIHIFLRAALAALSFALFSFAPSHAAPATQNRIAVYVLVESADLERDAALLIDSVRAFGGLSAKAPVYAVLADPAKTPGTLLKARGARLIALQRPEGLPRYPLADKVWAAAQAEELAAKEADVLVWMNPQALVVAPLRDLDLAPSQAAALRPVHIKNVGLPMGTAPDAYWEGVFKKAGITADQAYPVETYIGDEKIHAYFNTHIFAVRPARGLLRAWKTQFAEMLADKAFQDATCQDVPHKVFLHQALFSALMVAKLRPEEIRALPDTYSYPLHFQKTMPAAKRVETLNKLVHLVAEEPLRDPEWMATIKVDEPQKSWLIKHIAGEPIEIGRGIYRAEGSSNSYLVETPDGNVLIDAGSVGSPKSPLTTFNGKPVKAVLLTHGHNDHITHVGAWRAKGVLVVAQREFLELKNYERRLNGFLGRRFAIQFRSEPPPPPPDGNEAAKSGPNLFFADSYKAEIGGTTFEITHTGGETPDQSLIWIPERKALFIGDNFYTSFPNLYSLRGTKPRWALDFVDALDKARHYHPDVLLPGHGKPVIGAAEVTKQLTKYRDAILFVHDATVRGMNDGKDVYTLMREIKLPPELALPETFGRVSWSVRGIYEAYAGWFDGNPANMYAEPASSIDPELVKLAGGTKPIARRALELAASGEVVQALHLSDVVLRVEPANAVALKARLTALKSLRERSGNYIEKGWLGHGIREAEAALAKPAP